MQVCDYLIFTFYVKFAEVAIYVYFGNTTHSLSETAGIVNNIRISVKLVNGQNRSYSSNHSEVLWLYITIWSLKRFLIISKAFIYKCQTVKWKYHPVCI